MNIFDFANRLNNTLANTPVFAKNLNGQIDIKELMTALRELGQLTGLSIIGRDPTRNLIPVMHTVWRRDADDVVMTSWLCNAYVYTAFDFEEQLYVTTSLRPICAAK